MNIIDIIIIAVVAVIIVSAALYIRRRKKEGVKCIGCPEGSKCSGQCPGCASCN